MLSWSKACLSADGNEAFQVVVQETGPVTGAGFSYRWREVGMEHT